MDELQTGSAFLPYAVSTLSPRIIPNDLTSFKSVGVSQTEKLTQEKLIELKNQYDKVVEEFNWNKMVYESEFSFEPIVGETYYLYEIRGKNVLSMIKPDEWGKKHLGSFKLSLDKLWNKV